ncbi:hypothetical protein AWC11_16490 [Mycobacterium interjectum]|nr:hypothetical protein AWC11_16490 [Mycobacterium interjectum]
MLTGIVVLVVCALLGVVALLIVVSSRADRIPVPMVTDTGTPTSLAPWSSSPLPEQPFTTFPTAPGPSQVPFPTPTR